MKIYISGKIGTDTISDEIRDKFNVVAAIIENCGHEVVNPVDPLHQNIGGSYLSSDIDDPYTRHLLYDLALISRCDAIFLLPDWQDSPGAKAELSFAAAIGKQIIVGSYTDTPPMAALSHSLSLAINSKDMPKLLKSIGVSMPD